MKDIVMYRNYAEKNPFTASKIKLFFSIKTV